MELVWITPGTPYPPNQGERVVTFNRIKRLADRGHDVHVLSVVDDESELDRADEMTDFCSSVTYATRPRGMKLYARNPRLPYPVASRYAPKLQEKLDELTDTADVVVAEHTNMTKYLTELDVPTCFSVHNIETKVLLGMARSKFPSPRAIPYAVESARMLQYERTVFGDGLFDSYLFLSTDERAQMADRFPTIADRTSVSPIGVTADRFDLTESLPEKYASDVPTVVFTGTMRYEPNVDAVEWFVKEVFPKVRSVVPDVRFLIVGKEPNETVRRLGKQPGVVVTGRVPAIEPFIDAADTIVVPLREGGGVKIKLVEALASESVVVSTPTGAEGVNVKHGKHLWVAEDADMFAKYVTDALSGSEDSRELAISGRAQMVEMYAWSSVVDDLEAHLHDLARR
ncbi:glycosyltransferase [Halorussus salinus]|uniref:glycosyltransferase n=1 Tax=Halorussus salinus TaxID=1364935 RepID=UPI001091EF62|nr:glycosyltransferase [Halorussus salinus]